MPWGKAEQDRGDKRVVRGRELSQMVCPDGISDEVTLTET